jgi:hypothetical protein
VPMPHSGCVWGDAVGDLAKQYFSGGNVGVVFAWTRPMARGHALCASAAAFRGQGGRMRRVQAMLAGWHAMAR